MKTTHILMAAASLATFAIPSLAQTNTIPTRTVPIGVASGAHDGLEGVDTLVWEELVRVDGASWIRVRFGDSDLGLRSHVSVTSVADGEVHPLDAAEMVRWSGTSAYLNGDAALVRLYADPVDTGVHVELVSVIAGPSTTAPAETICGTNDNRSRSNNDRIGRLMFTTSPSTTCGCTAWRATNGAMVTAGHCVDFDPDQDGPLLPDGNHDLAGSVVQFNVPSSSSNGTFSNPPIADQFPFDATLTPRWRFDGSGLGFGKDWGVFAVTQNSLGELPHDRYGLPLRCTRELPAGNDDVRVTGYGADDRPNGSSGGRNSDNCTQQSDLGGFNGESSSGTDIWINYRVDTEGGNSGSPVMWFQSELLAIGVHTNGGCDVLPGTNNHGTSCENNQLENALHTWLDSAVEFADRGHPLRVSESGQIYRPWDSVAEAASAVPSGGTVAVVAGMYPESEGNAFTTTKAMTIVAPCGWAVIGN